MFLSLACVPLQTMTPGHACGSAGRPPGLARLSWGASCQDPGLFSECRPPRHTLPTAAATLTHAYTHTHSRTHTPLRSRSGRDEGAGLSRSWVPYSFRTPLGQKGWAQRQSPGHESPRPRARPGQGAVGGGGRRGAVLHPAPRPPRPAPPARRRRPSRGPRAGGSAATCAPRPALPAAYRAQLGPHGGDAPRSLRRRRRDSRAARPGPAPPPRHPRRRAGPGGARSGRGGGRPSARRSSARRVCAGERGPRAGGGGGGEPHPHVARGGRAGTARCVVAGAMLAFSGPRLPAQTEEDGAPLMVTKIQSGNFAAASEACRSRPRLAWPRAAPLSASLGLGAILVPDTA